MDVILGQIFGCFLFIIGLGMMLNPKLFKDAYFDVQNHSALQLISAIIPILLGAVVVVLMPSFVFSWQLSISLLGYALFVIGTLRYFFLQEWYRYTRPLVGIRYFRIIGFVCLLYAIFMLYHAFGLYALLFAS